MKYLVLITLILLIPLAYAENYANYQTAEIKLNLNTEIEIKQTGPNPRLIEAEGKLNLIPLETESQDILSLQTYSNPNADVEKTNKEITYNWKNVKENKITYGIESKIKVKNRPLIIKNKVKYPSFEPRYSSYTEARKYIDINAEIKNLANELFKGETDLFKATYKTAEYITKNIEYKRTAETESQVKKSSWVLKNKYGVCDELTNLFISILRVKNIPAKFISGVVYSPRTKEFENHGWAEVYFPNYGWLPFDLTYMQYGWIDITHIKMSESLDAGTSSVDYHWKSSGIDVEVNKLNIDADFEKTEDKIIPLLSTAIEPMKTKVGFGSYVPVKITVENPTNFYLAPNIYFTKAPQVLDKNKQTLFLKPKELKSAYFIVQIPAKLNENYIFKSELEIETSFGKPTSATLEFSSDYSVITKEEAESLVEKYTAKEEKKLFTDLVFDCTTKEQKYYENEDIEIICVIQNKKQEAKDLHICLTNDCKSATVLDEKVITFKTKTTDKIILTVEDEDEIKYSTINLDIIKIPTIMVKNIEPLVIDYNEEVDLKIHLENIIPSYDTTIYLGKQEILNTPLLSGKRVITTKVKGKNLINDIKLKMVYKDKLGKEYTKKDKYFVTITNKPWYAYLLGWLP